MQSNVVQSLQDAQEALNAAQASWNANKRRRMGHPDKISSRNALDEAKRVVELLRQAQTLSHVNPFEQPNDSGLNSLEVSNTTDTIQQLEIDSGTNGQTALEKPDTVVSLGHLSSQPRAIYFDGIPEQKDQAAPTQTIHDEKMAVDIPLDIVQISNTLNPVNLEAQFQVDDDAIEHELIPFPGGNINKQETPEPDEARTITPAIDTLEGLIIQQDRTLNILTTPISKTLQQAIERLAKSLPLLSESSRLPIQRTLENEKVNLDQLDAKISEKKAQLKKASEPKAKVDLSEEEEEDDKIPAGAEKWRKLSLTDRIALEVNASKAFAKYINTGDASEFNHTYRRTALTLQHSIPETATTTREATLMVHTNSWLNVVCRIHVYSRKYARDGQVKYGGAQIHGVPLPSCYGIKANPKTAPRGFMNCGCLIDEVLIEYYLWKTTKLRSHNPGLRYNNAPLVEGLCEQVINPRIRSFLVTIFCQFSGFTVDDLYTGVGTTFEDDTYKIRIRISQACNFVAFLQKNGVPAQIQLPSAATDENNEMDGEALLW
ncbi:hypothetical protein CPB83DRAFT_900534 [Crepidotus variabilis]|uniref:Uncharacterized protein n=1 Tax=Crepidotus variabilis TaxID=179855 RepID=A0A9P6E314_9AGAR|nr:hypothetical protein CPB83DRAFT_900534 [Crepidotus variabilis]